MLDIVRVPCLSPLILLALGGPTSTHGQEAWIAHHDRGAADIYSSAVAAAVDRAGNVVVRVVSKAQKRRATTSP